MITEERTDLSAEFMASSWVEEGLSIDKILFRSLGSFKRRSHQDVDSVNEKEIGHFRGQVIESNRNGIYDHLPEQLFHLPSSGSINSTKKKVDEIRYQREKEQKSRLFFLPMEQEFFRSRVHLARLEHQASDMHADSGLLDELRDFWQVPREITGQTFVRLLPVLPLISENRGNMEVAVKVLSDILRFPVSTKTVFGEKTMVESDARLSEARLGMDTIFGGACESYFPEIFVTIALPDRERLEQCLLDKNFMLLPNWLLGWFISAECIYHIDLQVDINASDFQLGSANQLASRLGYAIL